MGQTPPPSASCEPPECSNETTRDILSDISVTRYWYRNFTSNQQGTWYYRFQMKYENDETLSAFDAGTHKVTVEEDDVNITYTAGNNSGVIKDTQPQRLIAQVYDRDALTYNLTPNATVTFKVRRVGFGIYTNREKTIGTNTTNSSGHAEYNWNGTDCAWYEGAQNWSAEITDSEPNYKANDTETQTISDTLTACTDSLDATQILLPRETFQYRNFTINATVASIGGTADDVYATLMNIPSGWTVDSNTKELGSIASGSVQAVSWKINATTYGEYNLTVFANSSNAGNMNISSNNFTVYKERNITQLSGVTSYAAQGESVIRGALCEIGDYRALNLNATWNASTNVRVYVYNGTGWMDILHSLPVDTSGEFASAEIPVLKNQLYANGSGSCAVKIKNVGIGYLNVSNLSLFGHFKESVEVLDILARVNENTTTGLETSERLFNISVVLGNGVNSDYSGTLWMNISNSTGVVNYSSQSVSIPAQGIIMINFTEINTTYWNQGGYSMRAYLDYGASTEMVKPLTFKDVGVVVKSSAYICNGTSEVYNVTVVHPFRETVVYNISLQTPGWDFTPSSQTINATGSGNYSVSFNITSGQTSGNLTVNTTVNYTYPWTEKQRGSIYNVENGNIAILEIIRETPRVIGKDTVADAQLSVHNKGCAASGSGVVVREVLSTGCTPANPNIKDNEYTAEYGRPVSLTSSSTDLVNNIVTWVLGSLDVNEYAVLTYQVKAPNSLSTPGSLMYNASWDGKVLRE